MCKYLIFFLFLFISFLSNESLSVETSQTPKIKIYKPTCIDALSNALSTFTLPQVFKKVGASNIEITRYKDKDHITSLTYEAESSPEGDTYLFYMTYNVSFPVEGQIKTIRLEVGGFPMKDKHTQDIFAFNDKDDTEVLKRIRSILGSLPERVLNLINIIRIQHRPPPDLIKESPNATGSLQRHTTENYIIIYFGLPQDHPVYENGSTTEEIILQGLYHAKTTMLHGIGHIILLKHKDDTPDYNQKWQDAISADNIDVSKHDDIHIDENFIETMQIYIITNGGLYYPNVIRRYAHRFAVLDEIMGLTPLQRRQIIEINDLFEMQTNDLLQKFNLPTNDFRLQIVTNDVPDLSQKPLEEIRSEEKLTKNLRNSWRHNHDNLRASMVLANKASALPKERALDANSIENRLIRQILEVIATKNIPEFVIQTIHLFDTFSTSEMRHRLRIIRTAHNIFSERLNTDEQITLEEAFSEANVE